MKLLEIKNLVLKKGEALILKNVDIDVHAGEIHAVIGPNGAGKSSLAYAVMGLDGYYPVEGSIYFEGKNITDWSITDRAKNGLTLAWQEPARFEGITVEQYLKICTGSSHNRVSANGKKIPSVSIHEAMNRVGLNPEKYLGRMLDTGLSGGERKRIELASCLLMRPKAVILDEPDSGIDVVAIDNIFEIIREFKEFGISTLLITHSEKVLRIADRASLLCSGEIVNTGSPNNAADYYAKWCIPCPVEKRTGEVSGS